MSIERELEAVSVVDGLLVLMRESPGWDFTAADHAFSYLRRMRHSYPQIPLTVSVADELRRQDNINRLSPKTKKGIEKHGV